MPKTGRRLNMSLHLFGAVLTGHGVAANNRGENEGNITTLQKLLWKGKVHTTVSSEAIRWAIRYYWQVKGQEVNRIWVDEKQDHEWKDEKWKGWKTENGKTYIDDDLLGFMRAEGSKIEGVKGSADKRRGCLELARAISMTPFSGDLTFNAKSGEKGRTSLYGTEVHSTQYQYGFALTPERLREKKRVLDALDAIVNLGEVAGNHSRFLFDFSPESIVLRITSDPAPRILYCFEGSGNGMATADELVRKIKAGDLKPEEIYVGGKIGEDASLEGIAGINIQPGVKKAIDAFKSEVKKQLHL
jgi:CRISPR-associated protein Cst2